MDSVSVSELKAKLSHYLRVVRLGGEVQVLDRGVPVAKVVGLTSADDDGRQRLIASGVVRPATAALEDILGWDVIDVDSDVIRALDEDRDDRL
jgi:prevent-host-death family protein